MHGQTGFGNPRVVARAKFTDVGFVFSLSQKPPKQKFGKAATE